MFTTSDVIALIALLVALGALAIAIAGVLP